MKMSAFVGKCFVSGERFYVFLGVSDFPPYK